MNSSVFYLMKAARSTATYFGLLLVLGACGYRGLVSSAYQHGQVQGPTRLMVAPADFIIHEVGIGKNQERVVAWEEQASKSFEASVRGLSDAKGSFSVVDYTILDDEEKELVAQHRALFATMTPQLLQIKEGKEGVWTERRKNFRYSMGPGLAELRSKYGVEAVVFVVGKDTVRSTGRIFLDLLNNFLPGAESLSASNAYLIVGVADVTTGDVLLFDTDTAKRKSLSNERDVKTMAENSLSDYKKLIRDIKR